MSVTSHGPEPCASAYSAISAYLLNSLHIITHSHFMCNRNFQCVLYKFSVGFLSKVCKLHISVTYRP